MKSKFISTASEAASITGGKLVAGDHNSVIDTVATDSRETSGSCLYIPIVGENFDGHDFLPGLMKEGKISCALTMRDGFGEIAGETGTGLIHCDDTLYSLGRIGKSHREAFEIPVYGITGTNGKTTTRELVYTVLSVKYNTLKNVKNYNNEIGVPFTLLGLDDSTEAAVIEMGMNHTGEIERLSQMVMPDYGIITNVGAGHLEFLGTVEGVAYAKSEILAGMKEGSTLILNRDTECFNLISDLACDRGVNIVTFGLDSNSDVFPDSYRLFRDRIELIFKGEPLSVPLYGKHNVYNITAALAVAQIEGIPLKEAASAFSSFENIGGRSEILDRGYVVINDTYNSNPLSSLFALESVCDVFPERRKIAVLADMKELGESEELYHIKVGEFVSDRGFDMLLLFGEMSSSCEKGALAAGFESDNIRIFESKDALSDFLLSILKSDDVVLVKGSRSMKMEDVVNKITVGAL